MIEWRRYVDRKTGDFGGDCGGNFLTGAGGFLQGLWAGWGGMRIRLNSLDFITPRVPLLHNYPDSSRGGT